MLKNRQLAKYTATNVLNRSPVLYEKNKVWFFRKDLCGVSLQGRAFMRKVNLSRWSFKKCINDRRLIYAVTCT